MKAVETADVVIIGSGFGGAIPAYHLAAAGAKVVVLERGPKLTAEDLGQDFELTRWTHLMDVVVGDGVSALAGNCVGGGSMHYFAVSLRTPSFAFDRQGSTGRRMWPKSINRQVLDPWYERVERSIPVSRLDWKDVSYEGGLFASACRNAGRTCNPVPLAVDLKRCTDCGWMMSGCAFKAKRSMGLNYLPAAEAHGAQVRALHEVQRISKATTSGYRYRLDYSKLGGVTFAAIGGGTIEAKVVVVAAGAMATPVLLKRSAWGLGGMPAAVGRHFSPNGEQLTAFHMDQGRIKTVLGVERPGATKPFNVFRVGKSISTMAMDHLDGSLPEFERFSIQDCYFPIISNLLATVPLPGLRKAWFGADKKMARRDLSSWLTTLSMAEDDNEGVFGEPPLGGAFVRTVPGIGFSSLRYKPNANTRRAWSLVVKEQKAILEKDNLGGMLPFSDILAGGLTAHPLSSCRIGDDPATSALDDRHELRGHPGIFVTDGSAIPGALCVNPSLTISALAERASPFIIERLAEAGVDVKYRGSTPDGARVAGAR